MDFRGKHIDLVGKQNLWFGISGLLILVGMVSWVMFGLNLGIDFKGGGQYSYAIPAASIPAPGQDVELIGKVNAALKKEGMTKVRSQIAGGSTLVISTDALPGRLHAEGLIVDSALHDVFGVTPESVGQQSVGPVIGEELRQNAIMGVIVGVLLIALWIYIRYNFAGEGLRYSVAGIVALIHDVLVLIGLFALIGHIDPRIEIDSSFIAALLTVVGYSINDSVVIFDRIRENLKLRRRDPYVDVVNASLLETMSRSINTGATVLIMLFALLWFGGESIYNFVLAMLIGIASGLYSSIFNASMVLVAWHKYDENKARRLAAAKGATQAARVATAASQRSARATSIPTLPSAPTEMTETRRDESTEIRDAQREAARAASASNKARSRRRF